MGDTFFNGFYPFIDYQSGGGMRGMVAAIDRALPAMDDDTQIIPGHGPLSNRAGAGRVSRHAAHRWRAPAGHA